MLRKYKGIVYEAYETLGRNNKIYGRYDVFICGFSVSFRNEADLQDAIDDLISFIVNLPYSGEEESE